VLDGRQWRVASIAWNKDGNIVILDPAVAEYVRAHARVDRELEIGIPSIPVEVGAATDGETPVVSDSLVAGTPQKLPTMNTLCMCDGLRFHLAVESPILHELLSTSPLR
jgi:hypothetical protein